MPRILTRWVLAAGLLVTMSLGGCKKPVVEGPDYSRALPPGTSALRKITDPAQMPDFTTAFSQRDSGLDEALARSEKWFAIPSTQKHFPIDGITHERARASVYAFAQLLKGSQTASGFSRALMDEFDVYTSVGWDSQGTVLFTGYYTPIFTASLTPTSEYRYPLYRRPADLVSDPGTGEVLGRDVGGRIETYPTRGQIESSNMLAGQELVYLADPLDVYIIQVQGSARLTLIDGRVMLVGYAGNNGHEYTSIGQLLIKDGKIDKDRLSLATLRKYFKEHPDELAHYTRQNERYIFFQPYSGENWPAGSLGFRVTPMRSLATDKNVFPRGGVTLVVTQTPDRTGQPKNFEQFMLDQDTGGAIRAAGRGDIYMGIGRDAEYRAGYQFSEGRLYYLLLKPQNVRKWLEWMNNAAGR